MWCIPTYVDGDKKIKKKYSQIAFHFVLRVCNLDFVFIYLLINSNINKQAEKNELKIDNVFKFYSCMIHMKKK
jgi:hypothetical protein